MTAPSSTPKVQLIGVKKRFGPKVVLDGVDLTVEKQSSLVIIGGSGTGKSVTINFAYPSILLCAGIALSGYRFQQSETRYPRLGRNDLQSGTAPRPRHSPPRQSSARPSRWLSGSNDL